MHKTNQGLMIFADDDRLLRILNEELLLDLGYSVLMAADGEEAIALFERHREDVFLAVLDIVMPKIDGINAAKKMQLLNNQLPIIFITGKDRNEYSKALREIKNHVVLSKPYSLEKLSDTIMKNIE